MDGMLEYESEGGRFIEENFASDSIVQELGQQLSASRDTSMIAASGASSNQAHN